MKNIIKIARLLERELIKNDYTMVDIDFDMAMDLIVADIAHEGIKIEEAVENWFYNTLHNYPDMLIPVEN